MSIQSRYYRVDSGALPAAAKALHEQREAARLEISALLTALGASGFYSSNLDGRVNGIEFGHRPDDTLWKISRGSYWPKLSTATGKRLAGRLEVLPKFPPMTSALACAGIRHDFPMLLGEGKCWFATLTGCPDRGIWFVTIPTLAPEGEPGQRFTPPAEWVEVKRWQVEREIEEINAHQRREAAGATS